MTAGTDRAHEEGRSAMKNTATRLVLSTLGAIACLTTGAMAQSYPTKPIRMLVGFSPGGVADVTARLVGQKMSELMGQSVIVENRPGASGAIATERVATSPPDGYTLLMMTGADTVIPALRAKLPYDLRRDFAPVSLVAIAPFVIVVHRSVPAKNIKELIALARSHPDKLSYGSVGAGSTPHLAGESLKLLGKVSLVHVPYKGGGESAIATASGQVDIGIHSATAAIPLVDAGKLRALAVTSGKRASFMPGLPTVAEAGLPGFERSSWEGILAPAAVSKDAVAYLSGIVAKAVNTPEMRESFRKEGLEPQTNTPEQFGQFISSELDSNARLIRAIGLRTE